MPLESASTLDQLDPNNPTVSDGVSQGDDHIRLIKTAVQGSFPNFTGAGVTSTEAQLDAGAAVAASGTAKLADAGAFFNTHTTDGFTNPASGEIDVKAAGNVVVKLKSDKSAAFQGDVTTVGGVTATGPILGPGTLPIGGSLIWWSDTLPDSSWGTFDWCNGDTYPRSNTALFAILGTKYGTGNGTTTANLPDLRDNVPVGKATMGGMSDPNRITNFVTTTLGNLFGECLHLLGVTEMPSHTHTATVTDNGHSHNIYDNFSVGSHTGIATGVESASSGNAVRVGSTTETTGITVANSNTGGGTSHNNVQPSTVCNWIIRTA